MEVDMSSLSVVTIGPELLSVRDTVLRQRAAEVRVEDAEQLELCRKLALEMFEVMYANDGAGLAAPQVGISLRLVVMDPAGIDFGPHVLINPVIEHKGEEEEEGFEACMSLPYCKGKVLRSAKVLVRACNLKGELEEYEARGWLARVFQHEVDHLDGILYPDRLRSEDSLVQLDARREASAAIEKLVA
jgi:peptide deformylase